MSALSSELWGSSGHGLDSGFPKSAMGESCGFHSKFFVHVDECGAGGMGGVVVVYGLCGSGVV